MVGSRGGFERPDDAAPGTLKIFVDGGYRCAMRVRREGTPRTSGFLFYTREELTAGLLAAWRTGRAVVCHAIGNLGVETAVGAIEDAVGVLPEGRERVRIDHAIFLTAELIARIAALGEAMSVAEALEAYTLGAARAAGIDAVAGSLEPGKRADLLVLSSNPLACAPTELPAIRILETWMKGVRSDPP